MDVLLIISAIVLALCAIFIALCYIAYRRAFRSIPDPNRSPYRVPDDEQYSIHRDKMLSLIGELDHAPYESVTITSHDGLVLHARYYHINDGAPIHIDMHGYRSAGVRDFCGAAKILKELGHNALIVDQRAHSSSQGRTISFGINERFDCLAWINFVIERFGANTPIFLSGVSMGAGTVLMASGLELPDNVKGIFADCPFSTPWEIIRKVCGDLGLPQRLCFPFAYVSARLFGGFRLTDASAVEAVKKTRTPILIIHGDDDRFVPHSMSVDIASANPDMVRLVTVPDAGHALAYFVDTELYHKEIKQFTKYCLERGSDHENNRNTQAE